VLATKLRTITLARRIAVAASEPARSRFVFLEAYVDCQRQLSRQDNPNDLIRALALMQQWRVAFDYTEVDALIEAVRRTSALERSRVQFRLTMPDGSPLVSEQAA